MNTTLSIAFLAGLISFLSPCVLPLIPGYISYIAGTSLDKIKEKERSLIIFKTIFFTLGFSFVFIALGSAASFIGNFFLINSNTFRIAAGIIIILFSLQLIGIINFSLMNKDLRIFTNEYSNNMTFPLLVGAAFAFGWTPCIGPILGSIITLAALEENVGRGILLLSFYSLGLAIPFIISGILIDKFFRDGTPGISISHDKIGEVSEFGNTIFNLSTKYPVVYGISSIFLALIAGVTVSFLRRKISIWRSQRMNQPSMY